MNNSEIIVAKQITEGKQWSIGHKAEQWRENRKTGEEIRQEKERTFLKNIYPKHLMKRITEDRGGGVVWEKKVITLDSKMLLKLAHTGLWRGSIKSLLCWTGCGEEQERSSVAHCVVHQ